MILFLYENEDIEKIEKDHNEGKDAKIEKKKQHRFQKCSCLIAHVRYAYQFNS